MALAIKRLQKATTYQTEILKSQNVISKTEERGGRRNLPYAFTEQGIAMLSGILTNLKQF